MMTKRKIDQLLQQEVDEAETGEEIEMAVESYLYRLALLREDASEDSERT